MNQKTITGFGAQLSRLRVWICTALVLPTACFVQAYKILDLGSNSWSYSEAHGINGLGNVVGEYEPTNFLYVKGFLNESGVMTDVGHLMGAPYAVACGINDTNQVVGESDTAKNTHAFLYSNGTMTDLGTLAGATIGYSSAHAINRAGQIVGESSVSFQQAGTIHAVLYDGNSKTDLGALGGDYSNASAINNSGVIVGESDVVNLGVTNVHAFQYSSHAMSDLGTLGGTYSSAKGISDSGVIVGEADTLIGGVAYTHAFIYRNGTMSDLGTLGGSASGASAINTAGQVVGYATDTNGVSNAFLYDGSRMINLNDFIPYGSGWTNLTSADAINDSGQIAGSGYLADGAYHAYLLTPALPLTVAITNPAADASFQAPATFVVNASATDTAGAVTNVQFLVNGTFIGYSTVAPYSATASNLSAGTYTLAAIASDNGGLATTNSITVTVTNAALASITLSNPAFNGGSFSFSFETQAGFTYQGQYVNLLGGANNWVTFTNVLGDGSVVRVTDSNLSQGQRFYWVTAH